MTNLIGQRIKELLQMESITAANFAELLNVRPSNISHIMSERSKPGFDFISKILERMSNINPLWLINGVGNMYNNMNLDAFGYEPNKNSTLTTIISVDKPQDIDNIDAKLHSNQLEFENEVLNIKPQAPQTYKVEMDEENTILNINETYIDNTKSVNNSNNNAEITQDTINKMTELENNSSNNGLESETKNEIPINISDYYDIQNAVRDDGNLNQNNTHKVTTEEKIETEKIVIFYSNNTFEIYNPKYIK